MSILFCDIETTAAGDPIDPETLTPPGSMSKADTIAAWYKEKAPGLALEAYKKRALDSMEGQIICIGYAIDDMAPIVYSGDEKTVLTDLAAGLFSNFSEPFQWVGWNITTFDIPWLWRRAIKHGILDLRNIIPKGNNKMIIDLMRVWATDPYRDFVSMSSCADFLSIPHSAVSGADVFDLYKAGDMAAIEQHCREDVTTCREIYRRLFI
jgi:3'-5' exonuclease